jgi:disulfide bond formation protein DsbB
LFLGEVMGMTPCVLCWYQRIFMFPLAIVLGIAAFLDDRRGAIYALALDLVGLLFSAHHTLLVAGWVPQAWVPCGAGVSCAEQKLEVLHGIQIPWLSATAFLVLALLLIAYLKKSSR